MSINIEDLAGMDFSDIADMGEERIGPDHPGVLLDEILEELEMSQAEFARTIGVSPMRVSHVIKGTRPVTAELALLFGRAFQQTPEFWLGLQVAYDLSEATRGLGGRLESVQALPVRMVM